MAPLRHDLVGCHSNRRTPTSRPSHSEVLVAGEAQKGQVSPSPIQLRKLRHGTGAWTGGNEARIGVELAVDEINNSPNFFQFGSSGLRLGGGFPFRITAVESFCDEAQAGVAIANIQDRVNELNAVIGGGCSAVCEAFATFMATASIPQLAYGCSSSLLSSKRNLYSSFSRLRAGENQLIPPLLDLFQQMGWTRFGLIYDRDYSLFSSFADEVITAALARQNLNMTVVIFWCYEQQAKYLFQQLSTMKDASSAHGSALVDEQRVWVGPGWFNDGWWEDAAVKASVAYAILMEQDAEGGNGFAEFEQSYLQRAEALNMTTRLNGDQWRTFGSLAYDSTFMIARAVNKSLTATGKIIGSQVLEALWSDNFEGVSGRSVLNAATGDPLYPRFKISNLQDDGNGGLRK
eukprot:gene24031-29163_t